MKKYFLKLFPTLIVFTLVACQGSPLPTLTPVEVSTAPADTTQVAPTSTSSTTSTASTVSVDKPGCTVASLLPTPDPNQDSPFPAVQENDWVQGEPDAAVTLIEYGDFQ